MNKYLDYKTVTIIILGAMVLMLKCCVSFKNTQGAITYVDGKPYETVVTKVDTVFKTVTRVVYKTGKTIYKEPTIYVNDTLPQPKNLDSISKEYYGQNVYLDTLKLENSMGYVTLKDTIFKNAIQNREWKASITQITVNKKVIVKELPKTQVYVGAVVGFDRVKGVNFVGPSLLLKTKKDFIYSLSVGAGPNDALSVQGGLFWKIRFGK